MSGPAMGSVVVPNREAGATAAPAAGARARAGATPGLVDGLALAEHSVAFAQCHAGIVLSPAGRSRLVESVVGLVAELEAWAADPLGGPPDPWTYLRRRWHRQARLAWWGAVPATTRRMLTGVQPLGRDSLLQIAWTGSREPGPAVVVRWRTGLLAVDPAVEAAAAKRLARQRFIYHPGRAASGSPPRSGGVA